MPDSFRAIDHAWNQLLTRVASGEQSALNRLYEESSRMVYSVVLKIVTNPADAEEVTLDVYAQIWRKAGDYQPQRAAPATWLVILARSRALDRLRSARRHTQKEGPLDEAPEPADESADAEHSAWLGEQRERVLQALTRLPEDQRKALELAYYEGLSHGDISSKLDLPVGTIKTRIRLGMAKLRQTLAAEGRAE